MEFQKQVILLEEVSMDDIEVEVETTETELYDPLSDHTYILKEPKDASKSDLPSNFKIRELKVLHHCSKCGYATLKKDTMDEHNKKHQAVTLRLALVLGSGVGYKEQPKTQPKPKKKQTAGKYVPCPKCNIKQQTQHYEKCTKCSFFTKKKTSLKIHMRLHMDDKSFKCTECEIRVASLKELIKHYKEGHRCFQKFRCSICQFTSHTRAAHAAHAATHGVPQTCRACGFTTARPSEMAQHKKTHFVKLNKHKK